MNSWVVSVSVERFNQMPESCKITPDDTVHTLYILKTN